MNNKKQNSYRNRLRGYFIEELKNRLNSDDEFEIQDSTSEEDQQNYPEGEM